jgi:hypothetical protein
MGVDKIFSQLLPVVIVNVVGIMMTCTMMSYISTLAPKKYIRPDYFRAIWITYMNEIRLGRHGFCINSRHERKKYICFFIKGKMRCGYFIELAS